MTDSAPTSTRTTSTSRAALRWLLGAFALCASITWPTDAKAEPYLAVLVPLSGDHEDLGRAAIDGIDWGLTDSGIPVEFVDSAGDPVVAKAALERLAADPDVVAVIGPIGALVSEGVVDLAEREGLPLLTLTSLDGIEERGEHIYRLRMSPEDQSRVMAGLAVAHLESERAAVFYPDNGYGRGTARAFVDVYRAAGGRVTALEHFDPDESRPKEAAEHLAGRRWRTVDIDGLEVEVESRRKTARVHADFDVLFVPDGAAGVARALAFLDLAGIPVETVQLLGTSAWEGPELAGTEGRADGALVARLFDPLASETVEARVAVFVERFERQPTEFEAQIHDGAALLAAAWQRCVADPSAQGVALRRCIEQGLRSIAQIDGVTGPVGIASDGGLRRTVHVFDVDHDGRLWPAY